METRYKIIYDESEGKHYLLISKLISRTIVFYIHCFHIIKLNLVGSIKYYIYIQQ